MNDDSNFVPKMVGHSQSFGKFLTSIAVVTVNMKTREPKLQ